MKALPSPTGTLTTTYRPTHPSRWRLFLSCLRHPVLAFVAYQQVDRTPLLTERQQTLALVGILHGLVIWWITG